MIWPFSSKVPSLEESGMFVGMTDWHSHVLPGVDDGIKTIGESLKAIEHFDTLGVDTLWLTPHVMEDYPNQTSALREKFDELKDSWTGKLRLRLASEYMLDNLFEERLKKDDLLPIGDAGDHILVETSYFSPPMGFGAIIDNILSAGYYPVLAHPERYVYMHEKDYLDLKEKGVKFQLNYVSLVGGYGETSRKKSIWMLKKGLVDMTGSDIHRLAGNKSLIAAHPDKKEHLDMLMAVASAQKPI